MPRVFELPKNLQRRLREAGEMQGGELDEQTLAEHRRAYLDQSPRPILDFVADTALARLVILGDPGSGKSTLLQYLLLAWAEKAEPDLARDPLPLFIELPCLELRLVEAPTHARAVVEIGEEAIDFAFVGQPGVLALSSLAGRWAANRFHAMTATGREPEIGG